QLMLLAGGGGGTYGYTYIQTQANGYPPYTLTLPPLVGDTNQFLYCTDNAGQLGWSSLSLPYVSSAQFNGGSSPALYWDSGNTNVCQMAATRVGSNVMLTFMQNQ